MFIVDTWNGLLRFVFWMAAARRPTAGMPPPGGAGGGSGGGGSDDLADFEAIFKKYDPEVLRFFLRRGASREAAEDLTQETLIRVYQGIGEFRNESSLRTWIFSIADNVWKNDARYRKTDKRRASEVSFEETTESWTEISEAPGINPEVLEKILEDERKERLLEALTRLPPRMRQCVVYRLHQGLKYREIAALMGTDIGTVKAQISQAKARLKDELSPYFDSFDW